MAHIEALKNPIFIEQLRRFLLSPPTFWIRCSLFLIFVATSSSCLFNPSPIEIFSMPAEAINDGFPFHHITHQSGYLEYVPYYKVLGDHGLALLLSILAKIFSYLPVLNEYEFTTHEVYFISFFIFTSINIGLMFLSLPTLLLILTQAAFLMSLHFIDPSLISCGSNYRSIDGMAPIIIVLIAALIILREKKTAPFILLGVYAGLLSLFRQTVAFIFQFSLLGMVFLAFFFISREWKNSLTKQIVQRIGSAYLGFILVNLSISFVCAVVYKCPFSLNPPTKHGSGQPLYCSLGYVDNPYNIAWEDDNSLVNHILFYDSNTVMTDPHKWAENLGQIYWNIVKNDPLLSLKNISAKALKLNKYLLTSKATPENRMDIASVLPHKLHKLFYLIAIFYFLLLFIAAFFKSKSDITLLLFFSISILGSSLAAPLLIFPGYYASLIGFTFSASCILLPLFLFKLKELSQDDSAAKKRFLIFFLSLFLLGSTYVLLKNRINNRFSQSLLSDADPIKHIEEIGYEYGFLFNRLTKEDQEKILSKLGGSFTPLSPQSLFTPKFLHVHQRKGREYGEAHLIVFLSNAWSPPIPRADQGPAGSYILLRKGGPNFVNATFDYTFKASSFNRVVDKAWNGKYTFITLPVSKEFVESEDPTTISAWEMHPDPTAVEGIAHKMIGLFTQF